jgi:hypothetical protein
MREGSRLLKVYALFGLRRSRRASQFQISHSKSSMAAKNIASMASPIRSVANRGLTWHFLLAVGALWLAPTSHAVATDPSQQETGAEELNNDGDFTRPLNLLQLRFEYSTAPGIPRQVTSDILTLRADRQISLATDWQLALRTDLPFVAKNPITSDNPDGHFLYGLGDADAQASIIYTLNKQWAVGFGARLIADTGADGLGSGQWQIMPGAAIRTMLPEIGPDSYFVPLMRYDISFAGESSRKNISNLQLAPTLNLDLPANWFFTFYPSPDIRVNFGDPLTGQTGRLFLPFDFAVGRELTNNNDHWLVSDPALSR